MRLSYASSPTIPIIFQKYKTNQLPQKTHIPYRSYLINFSPILFVVADPNGTPNYHTSFLIHMVRLVMGLSYTSSPTIPIIFQKYNQISSHNEPTFSTDHNPLLANVIYLSWPSQSARLTARLSPHSCNSKSSTSSVRSVYGYLHEYSG